MSPDQPTKYELLTPEEAAQTDAFCDRFERAWKEAQAGAPVPRLANYVNQGHGSAGAVLVRELIALDRVCRERYSLGVRPEDAQESETGDKGSAILSTRRLPGGKDVPASRPSGWPNIPGLELVHILGSGGMGVVYRARQATLDRDVAVKFLRDAHRANSEQRERFLQEARAVARLRHPHLVQVYEFGEAPTGGAASQPYLVLEFVSGGSLADLLRGSPQPPREAAQLVEMLADAIHYAHQQGVIHRDLKPANILLQRTERDGPGQADEAHAKFKLETIKLNAASGREGQAEGTPGPRFSPPRLLTADVCAKITDFGLAKILTGSDLTQSGFVLGTPSYMAPEQTGKSVPLTAAVDVYGLGAILYETLTGRPPFAAATAEATLVQVQQDDPVPPRHLQPTVPRDLETICLKCLRKEPGRRYATALELADDLRRFQAGDPIRARRVGMGERVVVWCRRKPVVAALVAALVLVFLAGSSGVLWQWQLARRGRDTAQQEKERAEHHLKMIHERVDKLTKLGSGLLERRGQYRTGKEVLEEALAFYKELLPEEGDDPKVRREAARVYDQVAWIRYILGQADSAAEAWDRRVSLLTSLLRDDPTNKELRRDLAYSHRWRGNMLRDLGKADEAREAYSQAVKIQEELLAESPNEPGFKVTLANTLMNAASLPWRRDQTEEFEALFRRIVELDRAAADAEPKNLHFKAELALALQSQGLFFLDIGRPSEAEAAVRDGLEIHQRLFEVGHAKATGSIDRYLAGNFTALGRVLHAAGKPGDAEKPYRQALILLERSVKEFPESAYHRIDLVTGYLRLVGLLCELGRQSDAAEPYRKALELDSQAPAINNELAWFLATSPEQRLRDATQAVRLAKKAVDARQESPACWNTLGVAHYSNGDDKAAIAALETAMSLRSGGNSFDWFFLAMAHWRLGNRDQARTWFDWAVQWMDRYKPHDDQLRRFCSEAETMLTVKGKH
jgi:serine/threonine protein kinase/tetratricopeptide (TPR) repeat protein